MLPERARRPPHAYSAWTGALAIGLAVAAA
jgi:hypothetical protein